MKVYLGIDGGGTSTRVVAAEEGGRVVGVGRGGASNPYEGGIDLATRSVREAAEAALKQAGVAMDAVVATFAGTAGVVGAEDQALARDVMSQAGIRGRLGVDHDIRIALAGGLAGAEGMALIVGTGSSCYGRTADGKTCQSGGWGSILDDGGSAFGLGMSAMQAAVRVADGRFPPSPVLAGVLEGFGLTEIRQIVKKVYQTGVTKTEVGQLAPAVIKAWEGGDKVATEIVANGVRELVLIVMNAAERLDLLKKTVRVSTSGGLIENSANYRERVYGALREALPAGAEVGAAKMAPVLGAVLLAYEEAGIKHDDRVHDVLLRSYTEMLR